MSHRHHRHVCPLLFLVLLFAVITTLTSTSTTCHNHAKNGASVLVVHAFHVGGGGGGRTKSKVSSLFNDKKQRIVVLADNKNDDDNDIDNHNKNNNNNNKIFLNRRQWMTKLTKVVVVATAATTAATTTPSSSPAWAKGGGGGALSEEYRQGTAALSNMDNQAPVPADAYIKLPSGLVYADLYRGTGTGTGANTAQPGKRVNIQWVLRKSNGYFVDSSATQGGMPFIFTVGGGDGDGTTTATAAAIAGVDEGVRGMTVGGVRRLLIPVDMAYVNACLDDGCPGPLPAGYGPRQQMRRVQTIRKDVPGEYVYLEVQLTRVQ